MGLYLDKTCLAHNDVRTAEREGDWPLHLATYKQMMPCFFGAWHVNYARYGPCYLREMERLPDEVLSHFSKDEHVMHHSAGLWNGIWSDMMIETTFMWYGHITSIRSGSIPSGKTGGSFRTKLLNFSKFFRCSEDVWFSCMFDALPLSREKMLGTADCLRFTTCNTNKNKSEHLSRNTVQANGARMDL